VAGDSPAERGEGEVSSPRVAVIDDEANLRAALESGLRTRGFEVRSAADAVRGAELVRAWHPDAVILDIVMPGTDGLSLIPALRRITEAPILLLSARGDVETRVEGFERGADDYLGKPFSFDELVARLRGALRRPRLEDVRTIAYADVEVDLILRTVVRAGRSIPQLSRYEFDLFATLLRQPRRVFTREQLLDLVWGAQSETTVASVERFVSYLRAKVDAGFAEPLIHTVRGVGYCVRSGSVT
jgi:DNA-binding response OmpR family regulator